MTIHPIILALGICVIFRGYSTALANNDKTRPVAGVLLLQNGHVIRGSFSLAGNEFHVSLAEGGQLRVPRTDVAFVATNMRNVYEYRLRKIDMTNVAHHVELACWCQRNKLSEPARQHASLASTLAPQDPKIIALRQRIATESAAAGQTLVDPHPLDAETTNATPTDAVRQTPNLSKTSRQVFLRQVQPLLISHCSGCHSVASAREFIVQRPSSHGPPSPSLSAANLNALLREKATHQNRFLEHAKTAHAGAISLTPQQISSVIEPWLKSLEASRRPHAEENRSGRRMLVLAGAKPVPPSAASTDPFDPAPFNQQTFDQQRPTEGSLDSHATNGVSSSLDETVEDSRLETIRNAR